MSLKMRTKNNFYKEHMDKSMGSKKLIHKSQIHKEKQEIQPTSLDHPMLSI